MEGKFVFYLFVSSFLSLSFSLLFYHNGSLVPHHHHHLPFPHHQSFNLGVPKPAPLQMVRSIITKPPSRYQFLRRHSIWVRSNLSPKRLLVNSASALLLRMPFPILLKKSFVNFFCKICSILLAVC